MTTSTIAELNDACRSSAGLATTLVTQGVRAQPNGFILRALYKVQCFHTFTPDNDPHGEHDFGSFEQDGLKLFWKIDYYAKNDFDYGSEDPADPAKTSRVLTIMLASEY